jgi:hypothetical protein
MSGKRGAFGKQTNTTFWNINSRIYYTTKINVRGSLNWPNASIRTVTLGSSQPLTEMSTRNLPGGKGRPGRKADNSIPIREPVFYKTWEPRRLNNLWAFTACCRERFTFFILNSDGKSFREKCTSVKGWFIWRCCAVCTANLALNDSKICCGLFDCCNLYCIEWKNGSIRFSFI